MNVIVFVSKNSRTPLILRDSSVMGSIILQVSFHVDKLVRKYVVLEKDREVLRYVNTMLFVFHQRDSMYVYFP